MTGPINKSRRTTPPATVRFIVFPPPLRWLTLVWLLCLPGTPLCGSGQAQAVNVTCSNTTADAAMLNAAIAGSAVGEAVFIQGHCWLSAPVVLLGDRSYLGGSRTGTVLQQATGSCLEFVVGTEAWNSSQPWTDAPLRVAHLTVDGNRRGSPEGCNTTNGLVVQAWLSTIEDVHVTNAAANGILIAAQPNMRSSQVNGRVAGCLVENSGASGIRVLDPGNAVTDWSLLDNWVSTSGGSAIQMDNAAGWQVRGNHVYGVGRHAIFADRCFATTIADNYVEDFGSAMGPGTGSADDTFFGISCRAQATAGSVISGNKVFRFKRPKASQSAYVFLAVAAAQPGGLINVIGNVVRGHNGTRTVGLQYSGNVSVLSSGNLVDGTQEPRSVGPDVNLATPL